MPWLVVPQPLWKAKCLICTHINLARAQTVPHRPMAGLVLLEDRGSANVQLSCPLYVLVLKRCHLGARSWRAVGRRRAEQGCGRRG